MGCPAPAGTSQAISLVYHLFPNSWITYFWPFLVLTTCSAVITGFDTNLDDPVLVTSVFGVLGKKASLPCNISSGDFSDPPVMIFWFKVPGLEPLYSFDVRGRPYADADKWSSPGHFDSRAWFRTATTPAELVVDKLEISDEGLYRCRVDFRNSPTRHHKVNLTIIVPPEEPAIYDSSKRDRTKLVEPYNEGSTISLVCEVHGGRPRPKVLWFLDNVIVDESYDQRQNEDVTVNHIVLTNIERKHLNAQLVCQASNNIIEPPSSKILILDLNLKPLTVQIIQREKAFSAEKKYEIECRTSGSRPEAVITWWKGNKQIKKITKSFTDSRGQTLSILSFVPVIDDEGKYLTCRAENPWIPESALEDSFRLTVHFVPLLGLRIGANLNPDDIKEGDDVYFECSVRANPRPYKLAWFHNGHEIHQNATAGIVMSDTSLVLQSVSRKSAGDYTCMAANVEGKGTSVAVTLKVMYAPVCREDREELFGALKHETVALRCEVDSNPPLVDFHWTFNNSGDLNEVPVHRYVSSGTVSHLNYTPVTDMDYGTLSCWGKNSVGRQRVPCMYQVVAAGHPFPLTNCTIFNQTTDSLHVECIENFDGGLPQSFLVELLELPGLQLRRNVTIHRVPPVFDIFGLEPGTSYQVNLYAVNAKGRSEPFIIETVTFKGVAKYTGATANSSMSPVLTGLIATAAALVIVVCLVLVVLYQRSHTRGSTSKQAVVLVSEVIDDTRPANLSLPLHALSPLNEVRISDDTDPDVIPNKYERKPLKGLIKKYKTPPQRRRKKKEDGGGEEEDDEEEEEEEDELEGERTALNHRYQHSDSHNSFPLQPSKVVSNGGGTLRVHKGVTASSPLGSCGDMVSSPIPGITSHKPFKTSHEVVTTSHRMQESCI